MAEQEVKPVYILSDNPACAASGGADEFALEHRLGRLVSAIRDPKTPTPFTVALTGGWGTGKSSAMHWLEGQVAEKPEAGQAEFVTCFFKPWKYHSREEVLGAMLAEVIITTGVGKNLGDKAGAFGRGSIQFLANLLQGGGAFGFSADIDVGKAAGAAKSEWVQRTNPGLAFLSPYESALRQAIEVSLDLKGKHPKRFVLFIDDLDRCLPEVTIQVLEAMKLLFDQPGFVFVLGVDRDVVDRVMIRRYTESLAPEDDDDRRQIARKARQYLDKMFQVEVQVPPSDHQVSGFVQEQVKKLHGWEELSPEQQKAVQSALRVVAGINPRAVIRSLNSAFITAGGALDEIASAHKELEKVQNRLKAVQNITDSREQEEVNVNEANESIERGRQRLMQAIQAELVGVVLAGSEEAIRLELIDTPRHADGRKFLREWSQLTQAGGAIYLLPEQLEVPKADEQTPEAEPHEEEADPTRASSGGKQNESLDLPKGVTELQALARRHPDHKKLLNLRPLAEMLRLTEWPEDELEAGSEDANRRDIERLREAVARQRQVSPDSIDLEEMKTWTALNLRGSGLTNEEAQGLAQLQNLQMLDCAGNSISDLAPIQALQNLRDLDCNGTLISDLSPIERLKHLTNLSCADTPVHNLEPLSKVTSLRYLELSRTAIRSLAPLGTLHRLENLFVVRCDINDLTGLETLHNLNQFACVHTTVRDLTPLLELSNLTWIICHNCPVSPDHVQGFHARRKELSLPEVTINY